MSDETPQRPSTPEPVTVVGYPELPPLPSQGSVPGLAAVRMGLSTARAIAIAALVLVVVVIAVSVLGFALLRGQISTLSAQVTALQNEQAQVLERVDAAALQRAAPLEQQESSSVAQLPAAPALPSGIPVPGGVDGSGAIVIGSPDASTVVEVYADYQCPFCQRWETQIGEALARRAQDPSADLLLKQYNLAFLGETSPTLNPPGSSARAASAALCVLEGEGSQSFVDYNAQLFSLADPNRSSEQFATSDLSQLAAQAGASPETLACIDQERHVTFVALVTQSGFSRGVQGTPTVIVNGRTLEDTFGDPELVSLLG